MDIYNTSCDQSRLRSKMDIEYKVPCKQNLINARYRLIEQHSLTNIQVKLERNYVMIKCAIITSMSLKSIVSDWKE